MNQHRIAHLKVSKLRQPAFTVAMCTLRTFCWLFTNISFLLVCISVSVPRNVVAESITVRGTVTPNVVHIHINNVSL